MKTFISKDQLQMIAIRQPVIVEITPRTNEGDDDTDLIWEPGSGDLCEIAKEEEENLMFHKMGWAAQQFYLQHAEPRPNFQKDKISKIAQVSRDVSHPVII